MSSLPHGANTSKVEVTNIGAHGLWMFAGGVEHFLAFDDFPWFKDAPVGKILNVEEPAPGHFYWPGRDVDLGVASIEDPQRFLLRAK